MAIARCTLAIGLFLYAAAACPAAPAASGAWEQTVIAARKEGAVVISASSSELLRQVLLEFERDYPGIKIAYESGNARDFWSRLIKEREAGRYLWDLRIGGVSAAAYQAKDHGVLDPIAPALMLPEVVDDGEWLGGVQSLFADREKKYALHFNGSLFAGVIVDREAVPEALFKSPKDLLGANFRGKILIQDPRGAGGAGSYALAGFLLQYGEDFVRRLLTRQDLVVVENKRQMAEWVIRKRYPIAIGMGTDTLPQFREQGLGKNLKAVPGDDITGDAVMLLNQAPHPNAAKVYVNWLLSRKTQARLAEVAKLNSRRADVAPGNPELALDPKRVKYYVDVADEENVDARLKVQQLAKEFLK